MNHQANGHSNQNFVRSYNYGDFTTNHLKDFTYGGNSYGYEYDACGNMTKEASSRYYQWSHNDKLATFSNQSGSGQPTVFANYFYNSAGERVQKQVRKGSRIEVTFYMDGGLFETTYIKPTGGSIDNNRFYNTLNIQDDTSRIATLRIGNDADDPTPAVKFYLEDQVMNSTVVLKDNGTLINREEYYPFGETSFGGYGKKRYRYNGKEKDEESGLYNYGQRYYAPWLCRFVSVDPIAEKFPFLTPYQYATNDPITNIDLDGLEGVPGIGITGYISPQDNTAVSMPKLDSRSYVQGNVNSGPGRGEQALTGIVNLASGLIVAGIGFGLAISTAPSIAGAIGGVVMAMGGLTQAAIGLSQIVDASVNENPKIPPVGGGAELVGYGLSERTGNPWYRAAGAGVDIASTVGVGTGAKSIPLISESVSIYKNLKNFNGAESGLNIAKEGLIGYGTVETILSNYEYVQNSNKVTSSIENINGINNIIDVFSFKEIVEYTIQEGDTLSKIAENYGTSTEELSNMNNIKNPDEITAGETIIVSQIEVHTTTVTPIKTGTHGN